MATSELRNKASIVESGTDGIWEYRKWSDGTAECWGKGSFAVSYSAWGSLYSSGYGQWNYPSGLFVSEPICNFSPITGNGDAWLYGSGQGSATKTTKVAYIRATSANAGTGYVSIHAIGKWK